MLVIFVLQSTLWSAVLKCNQMILASQQAAVENQHIQNHKV